MSMNDQTPQQTPDEGYLTADQLLELGDDAFETYFRDMLREQLAWVHDMTTPCEHRGADGKLYADMNIEPHGMHSDDGWDYLEAAIQLASELLDIARDSTTDEKRNWVRELIAPDTDAGELTGNPYYDSRIFTNYASDGPANIIHALVPDPERG